MGTAVFFSKSGETLMGPLADRNEKFVVPLEDGLAVEAVFYGNGSLCVSSQAGCAVGCPFCASGTRGLIRNLRSGEMVRQLEESCRKGFYPLRVTVSGIGEPLHNPAAVKEFLAYCRRQGLPVSLTTTGGPLPVLEEFLTLPHNGLMVSLHAGTAATHRRLVPRGPDFRGLLQTLTRSMATVSRRRRRKLGLNYLLLEGINILPDELSCLAELSRSIPGVTVHLLACNPVPGSSYCSPDESTFQVVHGLLRRQGVEARRASRSRRQAEGGCGTLFWKSSISPSGR
jgi:23S rRNA (adenine2503-C2)-methyltransferase